MTVLTTNVDVESTDVAALPEAPSQTVISEQQVLLGSAAALAEPPLHRGRLRGTVRALFGTAGERRRTRRPSASHHRFIEDGLMAREMYRL